MCCIPWYTSICGRFVWENDEPVDLRGNCFLEPDLREAESAFICPLHSMWARMHFRKAVQKQIWMQPTAIEDIWQIVYVSAWLCNHPDCHVSGRKRCTSIGYVSIPNQRALAGHSGHCHLAGSRKCQANAGAPVLQWRGSLRLSEGDVGHVKDHALGCAGPYGAIGKWELLESNRIITSTSRVCDKICLAGQLAAGGGLWVIQWFSHQNSDIYLSQTRVFFIDTISCMNFRRFC